jgi:hypothetical protein
MRSGFTTAFPLSHRDVEELLAQRGISASYETVWCWAIKFGVLFAEQLRRREVHRAKRWHVDEVFLRMNGWRVYLWRATDEHGQVLNILVQERRNVAGDLPAGVDRHRGRTDCGGAGHRFGLYLGTRSVKAGMQRRE